MSNRDYRHQCLDKTQARKLISEIATHHPRGISFSCHALEELKNDDLTTVDILNVVKSSDSRILREPDFEKGSYRYVLETRRMSVVIAFNGKNSFTVVTAWRKR